MYRYNCALREDGKIYSSYGEFNEDLYSGIVEAIGNEPAIFPLRFIFVPIDDTDFITVQLFVLRNVKKFKVIVRGKFVNTDKKKEKEVKYIACCPRSRNSILNICL